ncbi:Glycosyl transferase family 2 [Pseudobutyrivibrio sp. OR37]|nr:Glycosyl transferase family 2 [Pseudobutyrivibrio sp. OR37]
MHNYKPLVSIIVPIYNIEEYIACCIESIINQTYANIEIILVDDGSTDKSGEICDEYRETDSRVIVIHKYNEGLVATRKMGLNICTGEYIMFVDGDDWLEADAVETLTNIAVSSSFDMVQCGFVEECEERQIIVQLDKVYTELSNDEKKRLIESWLENTYSCITSTIWGKLYSRNMIMNTYFIVPNDLNIGEDLANYVKMMSIINSAKIISKDLYHYRIRNGSLSRGTDDDLKRGIQHDYITNYVFLELVNSPLDIDKDILYKWLFGRKKEYIMKNDRYFNESYLRYYYPNIETLFGKKIIIYGAGRVGKDYYKRFRVYSQCEIVAWVDENSREIDVGYYEIEPVSYIGGIDYDCIVIAVAKEELANEIITELKKIGCDIDKMIWKKPIVH